MPSPTPTQRTPYPGRDRLNAATAQARRAFAAVHKEARRHDSALLPRLEALVLEAAAHLEQIAAEAAKLENASVRHQRAYKRQQDKMRALLRQAERRGDQRAAKTLRGLDAALDREQADRDDG